MLVVTGYLFDRWVFASTVYIPPLKAAMLYGGIVAAIIMWALVHFVIWPNLMVVIGETPGDAAAKAKARDKVRACARLNLILALPVTCIMIAAAHL